MTIYIIILIVATIGVALVTFIESLSKNKLIKYGSYIVYFLLIELILFAVTDSIIIRSKIKINPRVIPRTIILTEDIITAFQQKLLPAVEQFKPNLILISAD